MPRAKRMKDKMQQIVLRGDNNPKVEDIVFIYSHPVGCRIEEDGREVQEWRWFGKTRGGDAVMHLAYNIWKVGNYE